MGLSSSVLLTSLAAFSVLLTSLDGNHLFVISQTFRTVSYEDSSQHLYYYEDRDRYEKVRVNETTGEEEVAELEIWRPDLKTFPELAKVTVHQGETNSQYASPRAKPSISISKAAAASDALRCCSFVRWWLRHGQGRGLDLSPACDPPCGLQPWQHLGRELQLLVPAHLPEVR